MSTYLDLLNSALLADTPPEAKNRTVSISTPVSAPTPRPRPKAAPLRKPEPLAKIDAWLRGLLFAIFMAFAIWNGYSTPTTLEQTTTQASACPVPQESP